MKTAMQELIEYLEKVYYVKEIIDWDEYTKELIEKEKKQIIEAYSQGHKIGWVLREAYFNDTDKIALMDEEYYNQTYNQNK